MKRILFIFILFFGLLVLGEGGAFAVPITIDISGAVTSVFDSYDFLGGAITAGNIITGSYTYESTTPDSEPSYTWWGRYRHNTAPYGISVNINGFTFATDPANVNFEVYVHNNVSSTTKDLYTVKSVSNLPSNGLEVNEIYWRLTDPTATVWDSDALPLTPPTLSDWESPDYFTISGWGPSGGWEDRFEIYGNITSVTLSSASNPVPEPATLLLLGSGLIGMVGWKKKKRTV